MSSRAPRPSWTSLPPLDEPPATVLDWLCERFPRIGRDTWRRRMEQGLVTADDGGPVTANAPYTAHRRLSYFREVEEEMLPPAEVDLLHLDERLVVADKPPGLPVVPAGGAVNGCLLYLLERQLGIRGLAPVHRLDRETSGVVLFARRREDRGALGEMFAGGRVGRLYEALAAVAVPPAERLVLVESRIVRGSPFFRMQEVPGEPNARTRVELVSWTAGRGRFQLRPESGKKHQLRLHLARLGWPILGDRLYPQLQPDSRPGQGEPLHLVARRLAFRSPWSGRELVFESRRRLDDPRRC